jgi:hypothetical protein
MGRKRKCALRRMFSSYLAETESADVVFQDESLGIRNGPLDRMKPRLIGI